VLADVLQVGQHVGEDPFDAAPGCRVGRRFWPVEGQDLSGFEQGGGLSWPQERLSDNDDQEARRSAPTSWEPSTFSP